MSLDRLPYRDVRPTWGRPSSQMTVRYTAHPHLRLAFIQVIADPEYVFVVSDETLPVNLIEAAAIVERWRTENGETTQG